MLSYKTYLLFIVVVAAQVPAAPGRVRLPRGRRESRREIPAVIRRWAPFVKERCGLRRPVRSRICHGRRCV